MSNRKYSVITSDRDDTRVWAPGAPMKWLDFVAYLDLGSPADHKGCGVYAPVKLRGTRRRASEVVSKSMTVLDADYAGADFRAAVTATLPGVQAVAHTTWRHTPREPRYRLVVPLSRDVTAGESVLVTRALQHDLGSERFDQKTSGPERLMYLPSTQDPDAYDHWVLKGRPLDADQWLQRARALGLDTTRAPAFGATPADPSRPPTGLEISKARAVLAKAEREVEEAADGRNNACIRWLPVLYQFAAAGCLAEDDVTDRLLAASMRAPARDDSWGEGEFRSVAANAAEYALLDGPATPDVDFEPEALDLLPISQRRPGFPEPTPGTAPADALAACEAVFRGWLGQGYDMALLHVTLAAAAAERLTGDPLWLLVVGGPGNAKTETVQTLGGVGALVESTIASEGALLSGTGRRDRAADATGGLLRRLQPDGLLVLKDFTSILSMSHEARATVLGALREVYDGRWSRNLGTDGGQTLTWTGRVGVVGAVTSAWDTHHGVVAAMGDRFALFRATDGNRLEAGRRALRNTGREEQMRAELAAAVRGVLAAATWEAAEPTEHEVDHLLAVADLVTRVRRRSTLTEHELIDEAVARLVDLAPRLSDEKKADVIAALGVRS